MITIGTRFYQMSGDGERRQQHARESLLQLEGVRPINLQFADETFEPDGFTTRAVLRRDSRTVTGGGHLRKPIVADMFDALATVAREHGDPYFVYVNADIEVGQAAIDRIVRDRCDGYAFCRIDLTASTREPREVLLLGLDMFALATGWWVRNRRRFRDYIAGEAFWDNVYAAVLASHGHAAIVDEAPAIYHEQHAPSWGGGLYAAYNGYLAALDAPYFTRWAIYHAALEQARASGAPLDRTRLMRDVFGPPVLQGVQYVAQAARSVRARLRYAASRRRFAREPPQPRERQ